MCNFWNKWIIRVGVGQQAANRQQHFADGQCRTPLFLENIQADASLAVDIGMVHLLLRVGVACAVADVLIPMDNIHLQ